MLKKRIRLQLANKMIDATLDENDFSSISRKEVKNDGNLLQVKYKDNSTNISNLSFTSRMEKSFKADNKII